MKPKELIFLTADLSGHFYLPKKQRPFIAFYVSSRWPAKGMEAEDFGVTKTPGRFDCQIVLTEELRVEAKMDSGVFFSSILVKKSCGKI